MTRHDAYRKALPHFYANFTDVSISAMSEVTRSNRRIRPPRQDEVVDIGARFGLTLDSDSDSSDAEFAPENEERDSDDSHDSSRDGDSEGGESEVEEGEEGGGGGGEEEGNRKSSEEEPMESDAVVVTTDKPNESEGTKESRDEYNPLVVRRSQRAIKPTKDIDLYLLSAQFGVCLEESDADSSDMEFAVEDEKEEASGSSMSEEGEGEEEVSNNEDGSDGEQDVSRSVSELSLMQEARQTRIEIPLCCVCLEDSRDEGDIVECDHCGISVHEGCYGVPEDDGVDDTRSDLSSFTTVPWFCDACKAGMDSKTCSCELCPTLGGLFKQAVNGRWVHMVCSLYTPGIEYMEPAILSGVTLDRLPASKWGARSCQLCEDERFSKTGVCISCDAGLCKSYFHVTCAQHHGLLCEVDSEDEDKDIADPYFAHCKAHCDKFTAKRKRRDYLTFMTKQRKYNFDDTDDRIQHYLSQARKDYLSLFERMQRYYTPGAVSSREPRLLHFAPSAFRRLTQKAQLLGYEVAGISREVKKKIAPSLNSEFVNYFNERQFRLKSLREQQSSLELLGSDVKEQEGTVKLQLAALERELTSLRVQGHELHCQATALYVNLSRISDQNIPMPEFLKDSEEKEENMEQHKCSVCEKSHDPHMMALCDTCNKHYHIGCLDPPLSKVPKKTSKWGWQCHECCFSSGDELVPSLARLDEHASRCGRRIQPPKALLYPQEQVKLPKPRPKKPKSKKQKD